MRDIHSFEPFWGDWYIERELGHGSYGTVYLARKKDPKRIYYAAIKHIPIPADTREIKALYDGGYITDQATVQAYYEQMVSGMMAEIDACYALKGHTNIVSYEEHNIVPRVGEPGFDLFIKMEYLTPLSDYIIGRALTVGDVVRMGEDICTALTVLQRKQFVHRDIKPGNVFINDVGNFKLGDFGVARTMDRTMSGMSEKGTYEFMAPEVRQGGEAGYQVDIYSLGIMMYKLLNGNRSPFLPLPPAVPTYGQTEEARQRRFSGEALPLPAHGGEALGEIVLKACAFHKEDRWADAAEMKVALSAYCEALAETQADEIVLQYEQSSRELTGTAGGDAPTELLTGMIDTDATALLPTGMPLDDEPTPRTEPTLPDSAKKEENSPEKNVNRPKKSHKLPFIAGIAAVAMIGIAIGVFAFSNQKPEETVAIPTPTPTPSEVKVEGIIWTEPAVEAALLDYLQRTEGPVLPEDLNGIEKVVISAPDAAENPSSDTDLALRRENALVIAADDGFSLKDLALLSDAGIVELYIEGTIGAADLTPLGKLEGLTKLDLGPAATGDLTPLSALKNLTELNLSGTQVSDLALLSGLTSLSELNLSGTQVIDLAPLSGLINLSRLDLSGTQVSNVAPLSGLTNLSELDLTNAQVSDATPLSGLTNLVLLGVAPAVVETAQVEEPVETAPSPKPKPSPKPSPSPKRSPKPQVSLEPSPATEPAPPPEPMIILATGVAVSPGSVILEQSGSIRLNATVSPANASNTSVSWSSSNSAVASVDGAGNVMARGAGTAIIKASCNGVQGSCAVTVE